MSSPVNAGESLLAPVVGSGDDPAAEASAGSGRRADRAGGSLCRPCRHAQRAAIDVALANGATVRQVAEAYALSKSAVDRHKQSCLPAKVARANAERAGRIEGATLLDQMVGLNDKTQRLLDDAIETKAKPADIARIVREVRENIGMMGRLLGVFAGENAKTVDNRVQVLALREMSVDELRQLTSALRSKVAA